MSVGATVGSFPAPKTVPHTPLRIAMALPLRPRSPFVCARSQFCPFGLAGFAARRRLALCSLVRAVAPLLSSNNLILT